MRPYLTCFGLQISRIDFFGFHVCLVIGRHMFRNGRISANIRPSMCGDSVEVHPDLHGLGIIDHFGLFAYVLIWNTIEVDLVDLEVIR